MKATKIYTPTEYLKLVTGKEYSLTVNENEDNVVSAMLNILEENEVDNLWDYPIEEIDHIQENNLKAVLVDCSNKESCFRWFEVE